MLNLTSRSIKEIEAIDTKLGSVTKSHILLSTVWILFTGAICWLIGVLLQDRVGEKVFYLFASWVSLIAVFEGCFAKVMGVYSVSTRIAFRYLIDQPDYLAKVGQGQAIAGSVVLLLSSVLIVL